VLRERLPKRLVATDKEKRRLMRAGRKLGAQLKELASFVSYQAFARWLRQTETGGKQKPVEPKRKPGRS
jgi:putative transposase